MRKKLPSLVGTLSSVNINEESKCYQQSLSPSGDSNFRVQAPLKLLLLNTFKKGNNTKNMLHLKCNYDLLTVQF